MSEKLSHQRRVTRSKFIKTDMPAYIVIREKFGGLMNFCAATGFKPSQVHAWMRSGLIPSKWLEPGRSYQRHIIECGARVGVEVTEDDFVENAQ